MAYTVALTPAAQRQVKKLEKAVQQEIVAALRRLAESPRPDNARLLHGGWQGLYRIEAGPKKNYRILYEVKDQLLEVLVVKVADRKDAYR